LNDDNTFGPRSLVDLFGLTSSEWDLAQLSGMFFDHELSRVYYTLENDSRLLWRAFTPHGPLFGDTEFVAEEQSDLLWNDVRGMDVIDGKLYFGYMDGSLYRMDVNGVTPVPGSIERVSGPGIDGQTWDTPLLAFSSEGAVLVPQTGDGTRKWLTAPPGNGGMYKVSVKIREGSTAYAVSINPTEEAPVPLADFEFSASGSETVGRWQTFRLRPIPRLTARPTPRAQRRTYLQSLQPVVGGQWA